MQHVVNSAIATSESRCDRRRTNLTQNGHQFINLFGGEEPVWALGCDIDEWRLVEQRFIHRAVLGQVVDDQADELNLVGPQGRAGQKGLTSIGAQHD